MIKFGVTFLGNLSTIKGYGKTFKMDYLFYGNILKLLLFSVHLWETVQIKRKLLTFKNNSEGK